METISICVDWSAYSGPIRKNSDSSFVSFFLAVKAWPLDAWLRAHRPSRPLTLRFQSFLLGETNRPFILLPLDFRPTFQAMPTSL